MRKTEQSPDRPVIPARAKRQRKPLRLTPEERSQLERWRDGPRRLPGEPPLADRARVILACAETTDYKSVASACSVSLHSVYYWRSAFLRGRLAGLLKPTQG